MIIFKRKIYDRIKEWKENSKDKTALLIEGAKGVGKTTVAREFASKEYKSYIHIDFSKEDENVKNLFNTILDLEYFFLRLQLHFNVDLFNRESLIIFDEVQFFPLAREAIKYLVDDGRYDYIELGSFVSVEKNIKGIQVPTAETKIDMHPLDAEEFRWACGDFESDNLIKESFESKASISGSVHEKLMRDFRVYMFMSLSLH